MTRSPKKTGAKVRGVYISHKLALATKNLQVSTRSCLIRMKMIKSSSVYVKTTLVSFL
jgi:hypothetical protein